jgi:exo-beta-1,3-glucanase (GH17 family)
MTLVVAFARKRSPYSTSMSSGPEFPLSAASLSRRFVPIAYVLTLLPALAFWWWQGRPVPVVDAPSARVPCVSYAPYRGSQTPFDEDLVISPKQIENDLRHLATMTGCVRTYAIDQGVDQVPRIARDLGMKVMLGAWVSYERAKNEKELAGVIDLARRYPETISAIVVGNEVLLRREQPAAELAAMIRRVRAAADLPVTYADVWEFWRKHPEVADAVDFVTIHTLPYWEDEPVGIDRAIPHVERIWRRMRDEFHGKPVFIGEAGWPSAGRMRGAALPSPVNQARFVRELMAVAEREGIGINLIESFDQPWKRRLEGTVGVHWGLLDEDRMPKFPLTGPVSNDPDWPRHFALAAALGLILLIPALVREPRLSAFAWLGLAAGAIAAASLLVIGFREGMLASGTMYDWTVFAVRWLTAASAAALVLQALPRCAAGGNVRPLPMAELLEALRGRQLPAPPWHETALGVVRAVALFGATATTLCLAFDPRYRDFANALHAVTAFAFVALAIASRPARAWEDLAEERLLAIILAAGGIAVAVREGFANHQALIWAALALILAIAIYLEASGSRAAAPYRRTMASAPSSAPPAAGSGT